MRNKLATQSLFALSQPGRRGAQFPAADVPVKPLEELIPAQALATAPTGLPEVTESDVNRRFVNLSTLNMCVDTHFYPLGSCTMKYNPKRHERHSSLPGIVDLHPYQKQADLQGMLGLLYEMQEMLDAFLDFARSESLGEPERIDPTPLIEGAVEKAIRAGGTVELGLLEKTDPITLRPPAFDRVLSNLIGNAMRYGSLARVSLRVGEETVAVIVEDNGPGIEPEHREAALKPFTRLDQSRNQDAGSGVGLGLAIAGDIARQHGGTIELGDSSELGGLKASIVLPR